MTDEREQAIRERRQGGYRNMMMVDVALCAVDDVAYLLDALTAAQKKLIQEREKNRNLQMSLALYERADKVTVDPGYWDELERRRERAEQIEAEAETVVLAARQHRPEEPLGLAIDDLHAALTKEGGK